jgi:hypothetical protein
VIESGRARASAARERVASLPRSSRGAGLVQAYPVTTRNIAEAERLLHEVK